MFIDANVFIYAVRASDETGKKSRAFLERVIKGEQHASTSVLVLNEVLFFFLQADKAIAIEAWNRFSALPNLDILPLDAHSCRFVPEFVSAGLRPNDAFHASAMKSAGIISICSFDSDFDKIRGLKRQEPK